MKIINLVTKKPAYVGKTFTCKNCGTTFEMEEGDGHMVKRNEHSAWERDTRERCYLSIPCPSCYRDVYLGNAD